MKFATLMMVAAVAADAAAPAATPAATPAADAFTCPKSYIPKLTGKLGKTADAAADKAITAATTDLEKATVALATCYATNDATTAALKKTADGDKCKSDFDKVGTDTKAL